MLYTYIMAYTVFTTVLGTRQVIIQVSNKFHVVDKRNGFCTNLHFLQIIFIVGVLRAKMCSPV